MRPILLLFLLSTSLAAQDISKLPYTDLDSLMKLEYTNGNYKKAITYSEAAGKKAKLEFGAKSMDYAKFIMWGALLYQSISKYQISESLYLEAINICAKSTGKESEEYVSGIMYLAYLYVNMGEYNKALPLYLEANVIYAKLLGKDHPDYATSLNDLAMLYELMGRYEFVEPLYLEAKAIFEKKLGKEDLNYSVMLNNLAKLYIVMGNFAQAEQYYVEAKSLTAKILGKEHSNYATNLNNLALLYIDLGRFAEAEPLLLEAKSLRKKILGENHPDYGASLNNLAGLYRALNDYKKAESLYLEAIPILEKTIGKEHPNYAETLSNLARVYDELGDYAKAEALHLKAESILKIVVSKSHPKYLRTINSLAQLYKRMGKLDKSRAYLEQAIACASGGEIELTLDDAWVNRLMQATYNSSEVLENMEMALSILYDLIATEKSPNANQQQVFVCDLATQLLKKSRDGFSNENDKLHILSLSYEWMLRNLKVLDLKKQADKAFEAAELSKASLLLEASKTEQAYQMGDLPDSLAKKEKELFKKHSDLEADLLKNHPDKERDSLRSVLNNLTQEIRSFKKEIEKKYPKYAVLKYQQNDIQIIDLQKTLAPNAAVLEYVIGDSVVYVFYIDKQTVRIIPQPIAHKELDKRITALHDVLSNYNLLAKDEKKSYQVFTEEAHWFYKNLIAPVLTNKNINKLIIISDEKLGHLPFETFLVEPANQDIGNYTSLHYLIQDYKISYHYSAMLLSESLQKTKAKQNHNGQIFAMAADYTIQLDSNRMQLRLPLYQRMRAVLNPLPEAQKEINLLKDNFQGFFAFDKMASEKVFKEKASDYGIIHLAMHGLLDSKAPIMSSLAFTEDGDSVENNFLQAYEISKMRLNADLVVLSACETGFGKFEKGNGIASLARAFMYAGVPSMIVSLWEVNDFATAELMKYLYKNLADGMDKDAALQEAKIQYIQHAKGIAAHPAFWSPFIQIGNTDAIYLKTKSGYFWWVAGVCGLALGGCLLAMKRKKNQ